MSVIICRIHPIYSIYIYISNDALQDSFLQLLFSRCRIMDHWMYRFFLPSKKINLLSDIKEKKPDPSVMKKKNRSFLMKKTDIFHEKKLIFLS